MSKEYILKSTADKKLDEYVKLSDRILHDIDTAKDKRMQEILKPIRDTAIQFQDIEDGRGWTEYFNPEDEPLAFKLARLAIKETLKLADKK